MRAHHDRRSDIRRSTILVTSNSLAFVQIVGDMVSSSRFTVAIMMPAEPAWLSLTRTQPVLVICDAGVPQDSVRRLITETLARRLPLLMLGMTEEQESARERRLPTGVAWLPFPLARDVFESAIDELLTPARTVGRRFVLASAGVTVQAGFVTRTVDGTTPL